MFYRQSTFTAFFKLDGIAVSSRFYGYFLSEQLISTTASAPRDKRASSSQPPGATKRVLIAMAVTFSEREIESLIHERKLLPPDWRTRIRLKSKRGHEEQHLDIAGGAGSEFRLILRQNKINPLNFSVILAVRVPGSNQLFRLRRYNGKSQEHSNRIEGVKFYDFHIHVATERYQEFGTREDGYADPTDRFGDYHGALRCLISDVNLVLPPDLQVDLFEEV